MLTFDGIYHFGEMFYSWVNPNFHSTGQIKDNVWHRLGEWFADVSFVNRVAHGGSWVMLWVGICFVQQTQLQHVVNGPMLQGSVRDSST